MVNVDTDALTLIERSKLLMAKGNPWPAAVMEIIANKSPPLQYLPFENVGEKKYKYLGIAGADFDVDTSVVIQRALHETMLLKSRACSITNELLFNNSKKTHNKIEGIKSHCTNDQLFDNTDTVHGSMLSITNLDRLIASVNNPTHLLMNQILYRRFQIWYTKNIDKYLKRIIDAFGRWIIVYKGLPIINLTEEYNNSENYNFNEFLEKDMLGNKNTTSIYCLSLSDKGIVGIQDEDMRVTDLGLLTEKPVYRTRMEWYVGLEYRDPKACARLRCITDEPIRF